MPAFLRTGSTARSILFWRRLLVAVVVFVGITMPLRSRMASQLRAVDSNSKYKAWSILSTTPTPFPSTSMPMSFTFAFAFAWVPTRDYTGRQSRQRLQTTSRLSFQTTATITTGTTTNSRIQTPEYNFGFGFEYPLQTTRRWSSGSSVSDSSTLLFGASGSGSSSDHEGEDEGDASNHNAKETSTRSSTDKNEDGYGDGDGHGLTPPTSTAPNERAILLNRCLDAVLHPVAIASGRTTASETITTIATATTSTPSQQLMEAALRSLQDPSGGYDPRYGRPALRAYRSFLYPKPPKLQQQQQQQQQPEQGQDQQHKHQRQRQEPYAMDGLQLEALAKRTANQIDFLVKRQTSKLTHAVRNHDDPNANANANANSQNTTTMATTTTTTFPITLVLDNLRGSFNVGSIFRTAEACGVREILTCGITPHPFGSGSEKVAKSALGADLLVPTRHFGTTLAALRALKPNPNPAPANTTATATATATAREAGTTPILPLSSTPFVVALETTSASKLYTSIDYRPYYEMGKVGTRDNDDDGSVDDQGRGIALILGNEVTGVDVELLAPLLRGEVSNDSSSSSTVDSSDATAREEVPAAVTENATTEAEGLVDAIVELPTHGQKNSLNVAAVAPVILYEILRQWTTTTDSKQDWR